MSSNKEHTNFKNAWHASEFHYNFKMANGLLIKGFTHLLMSLDLVFYPLIIGKKKNEVKGMSISVFVTQFLLFQPEQKDFQHSIWTVSDLTLALMTLQ